MKLQQKLSNYILLFQTINVKTKQKQVILVEVKSSLFYGKEIIGSMEKLLSNEESIFDAIKICFV